MVAAGLLRGSRRLRASGYARLPSLVSERPADLVQRASTATRPNQLLVADLTHVATWRGFV